MTAVLPPDLEAWLCAYLRSQLKPSHGTIHVSNREPDDYNGSYPLVVVRDDGGSQSNRVLFDRSIGITVRYGSRSAPGPCRDLAARIYGLLTDPEICSLDSSPIAGIDEDGCNGPYFVAEDANIARCYLTLEFSAIGKFQ
nr:MAG TPA: tail completion protein [Caudoviricetes sp.]DAG85094.1 MAG TPA: tail completion protein [Caudoviricetes sp.]